MDEKILGAVVGDMVGSTRERNNVKTTEFELLPDGSCFTDDTVMTLAVAEWLVLDPNHRTETLIGCMKRLGRKYPDAGYGWMFQQWLNSDNPEPYNSFGNGSAMRVSPVGLYANSLNEALELARISASVSHNHPEGVKGAQAIAACVYLKKERKSADEIRNYISRQFGYNLDIDLNDIRDDYAFDVSCQGSVPVAIMAFLQGRDVEGQLRLAISMGGDSDTIGAMTCSIATARPIYRSYSGLGSELERRCRALLTPELLDINDRFFEYISKPHSSSELLPGSIRVFWGECPDNEDEKVTKEVIRRMYHFGVRHFIDLDGGDEKPYSLLLPTDCTYTLFPLEDTSEDEMERLYLYMADLYGKKNGCFYMYGGKSKYIEVCYKYYIWNNSMSDPELWSDFNDSYRKDCDSGIDSPKN